MIKQYKSIIDSNHYKIAELKYWNEIYHEDYWLYYCKSCDFIGLSKNIVVKEEKLDIELPFEGIFYQHHCPMCDKLVTDPMEDIIWTN
jgi:hypothetical protein